MSDTPALRPDALVLGIGNSGRTDDGLGWAFIDWLRTLAGFRGRSEYRYQLQVEDAALVADAPQVVFVDACREPLRAGFRWQACEPAPDFQFTTHALPPRTVLALCQDLYPCTPPASLLMIQGVAWDLGTELSPAAAAHLGRAQESFRSALQA